MIPLTPALLVATAQAFVDLGEEGGDNRGQMVELFLKGVGQKAGAPWCAAFVHHVGYRSHFDHRLDDSSWPLPATASCWALHDFAERHKLLRDTPRFGDVFLVKAKGANMYIHTGIVVTLDDAAPTEEDVKYVCTCIEGNTNNDGSSHGYTTLRRPRKFREGDKFIRWVLLDGRRKKAA